MTSTKAFLAGHADRVGEEAPSGDAIAGAGLLAQGMAHVLTIRENGCLILDCRDLSLDHITGLREVSHRGNGVVVRGGDSPPTGHTRRGARPPGLGHVGVQGRCRPGHDNGLYS